MEKKLFGICFVAVLVVIGIVIGMSRIRIVFVPPDLSNKDFYYCGKQEGVEQSHPEISNWSDKQEIRNRFKCDRVDAAIAGK